MTFVFDSSVLMVDYESLCRLPARTWQQDDGDGDGGAGGINQSAALTAEGNALLMRKRNKSALSHYTKALAIDAENAEGLVGRSKCHLRLGNTTEALKDAEEALQISPHSYKAIYQKAEALYAAGDFEHALVYYCRGAHIRKEKECFRLGIQKAQEAIANAVGSRKVTSEPADEPRGKLRSSRSSKTASPSNKSCSEPDRRRTAPHSSKGPFSNDSKAICSGVLRRLHEDTEYLETLLTHPSLRKTAARSVKSTDSSKSEKTKPLKVEVKETLDYLKERREFWLLQDPLAAFQSKSSDHNAPRPCSSATGNGSDDDSQ